MAAIGRHVDGRSRAVPRRSRGVSPGRAMFGGRSGRPGRRPGTGRAACAVMSGDHLSWAIGLPSPAYLRDTRMVGLAGHDRVDGLLTAIYTKRRGHCPTRRFHLVMPTTVGIHVFPSCIQRRRGWPEQKPATTREARATRQSQCRLVLAPRLGSSKANRWEPPMTEGQHPCITLRPAGLPGRIA